MKISAKVKSFFWIAVVLAILVLSWIGLAQLYPETNTLRYLPDRIFRLIKIMMGNDPMGSKVEPEDIPWALIVVKILVTMMLLRALLKVVEKVFQEQYTQLRIAFKRGHTIVVGAGDKGVRILKDYQQHTGHTAVVIEQNAEHKNVSALRRSGHAVVIGNATDSDVLQTAGVCNAQNLICFNDNEQIGIQMAASAIACYAQKKPAHNLRCFIHLKQPLVVDVFQQYRQEHLAQGTVSIQFFNLHKMLARHFFHHLPQHLVKSLQQPQAHFRFLLMGFETNAQALLLQALRVFHLLPTQSIEWRVITSNAAQKQASFVDAYPLADHICQVSFEEQHTRYAELLRTHIADLPAQGKVLVICATDNDQQNLRMAAALMNASGDQDFPIFILNTHASGVHQLLQGAARQRLHFFGDYDDFCSYELITAARQDNLAKAIHADYLQQTLGATSESAAYQQAWDNLPEDAKEANRAQADHIIYKLALSAKLPIESPHQALVFTPEEVEALAITEHQRWAAHRYLNGWCYGAVRSDADKRHPSLCPWDALDEAEKQKDRDTVLRLSSILQSMENVNL